MLPHTAEQNAGCEERPSLPSIHDLFGVHLAEPINKRHFSFSLSDLGSSLPVESSSSSPGESPRSWLSSGLASPRPWSQPSGLSTSAPGLTSSHSRSHSDASTHFLTTPSTASSHEHFITLPPIDPHFDYNRGDGGRHARTTPSARHISQSMIHGRSRSTSVTNVISEYRPSQTALEASLHRRHTVGTSQPLSSYSLDHTSSPFTPAGLPSASRLYAMDQYPAGSMHPSLHPVLPKSSPSPCPPSPPSTASGDEAGIERKKAPAKYGCQYCGKHFNRPSSLKLHHNTHTGEKPFACPFPSCGRHFSVMSNMRRHARIHGEMPTEGTIDDNFDALSASYSSSPSTHSTSIVSQAATTPSYTRSRPSSSSSSPRNYSTSLPTAPSRVDSHRRQFIATRSQPYPYRLSRSPSNDGGSSPERY